jgi:hypothetical protein
MSDSNEQFYVLGKGNWTDLLPTLPRPVFALGSKHLYRVMIQGEGFALPVGPGNPAVGFFTARFVAASNRHDAERFALDLVAREWANRGYKDAAGEATLTIDGCDALAGHFRLRSGIGFTFYSESDEGNGHE